MPQNLTEYKNFYKFNTFYLKQTKANCFLKKGLLPKKLEFSLH